MSVRVMSPQQDDDNDVITTVLSTFSSFYIFAQQIWFRENQELSASFNDVMRHARVRHHVVRLHSRIFRVFDNNREIFFQNSFCVIFRVYFVENKKKLKTI